MLTVEGLFQNHRRLMESVARRYVPVDDVPDVLQSVAVTLCQKLHTFRAESQVQIAEGHRMSVDGCRQPCQDYEKQYRTEECCSTPGFAKRAAGLHFRSAKILVTSSFRRVIP